MDVDKESIMTLVGLAFVGIVSDTLLSKAGKPEIAKFIDIILTVAGLVIVIKKIKPVVDDVWRDFL